MHFFALKQDTARTLLVVLVALLFFGTLMPGNWKEAGTRPFASLLDLAAASHVALFALIAFLVPRAQFWRVRPWHVFALGAALALLTEGLQFFAVDRHPNVAGLSWDMIGTLIGWSVGRMVAGARLDRARAARASATGRSTVRSRRR
jgi:VanZ family protein